MRLLGISVLVGLTVLAGFGSAARANPAIYKQIAPSTVWFFEKGSASGVLIDAERRLVLTAEHVVRARLRAGRPNVKVIFAQKDADNNILTELSFYGFEKKRVLAIAGRVIYSNRLKDIAIVQLDNVPPGIPAVPLAQVPPQPGDTIHVIGNSTFFNGGLFSYSTGSVRNSYYYDRFNQGDVFFALAHHAPTNRGDSGGPVVNSKGELVAIVSQGTTGSEAEQVIDHSVHIRQIRMALEPTTWPVVKTLTFNGNTNVPGGEDKFFVPVRMKNAVQMKLRGNGKTDLDLYAMDFDEPDHKKQALVAKTSLTDQEDGSFIPGWTGVARVVVKNLFLANDPNRDFALTAKNSYTLEVTCPEGVPGPLCINRPLAAGSTDTLRIYYEAGRANARIQLRGDGDTELVLIVSDPNGTVLAKGTGINDRKQASFPVAVSGTYTISVGNNSSRQYNSYVLSLD
jgi:hypothetical protein